MALLTTYGDRRDGARAGPEDDGSRAVGGSSFLKTTLGSSKNPSQDAATRSRCCVLRTAE
jgi:hypothetical protein